MNKLYESYTYPQKIEILKETPLVFPFFDEEFKKDLYASWLALTGDVRNDNFIDVEVLDNEVFIEQITSYINSEGRKYSYYTFLHRVLKESKNTCKDKRFIRFCLIYSPKLVDSLPNCVVDDPVLMSDVLNSCVFFLSTGTDTILDRLPATTLSNLEFYIKVTGRKPYLRDHIAFTSKRLGILSKDIDDYKLR